MAAKKMSLEECFEGLDDIIVDLQSGELSLEDSFKKYEEGMTLIKKCMNRNVLQMMPLTWSRCYMRSKKQEKYYLP